MSSNNNESKMNQTMAPSYVLNKSSNSQLNRKFENPSSQFITNNQSLFQDLQNYQQNVQNQAANQQHQSSSKNADLPSSCSKLKLESNDTRNLNTNLKSMISPEQHTHFKKQKIQNLKNEDYYTTSSPAANLISNQQHLLQQQPINSNNASNEIFRSVFSQVTQPNTSAQQTTFRDQINNIPPNSQMNFYSDSMSSESSSNHCSPDVDHHHLDHHHLDHPHSQLPMNLIKNNQDTSSSASSSSNEIKDDIQSSRDMKQHVANHNTNSTNSSSTNSSSFSNTIFSPSPLKFPTQSTNSDSCSSSATDHIEIFFTKQPAKYHRARYMTEGSRGPIRDKTGKSFPTIKLKGYNKKPVKAYCYLIDDKQISQPHLFYQASKLTSRCLTNCNEVKLGNTIALEFELHPRHDMELMIDCLGIVKQRLFEIQQQQHNSQEKSHFKTPYCRLAFEVFIEEYNHIAKTYSDTIHCKQMLRACEIHRMSIKECHVSGDKELFIIGKNFTKDVKLYFSYGDQWHDEVIPVKELFHQAHIVCNVPKIDQRVVEKFGSDCTDKDGQTTKRLTVELYALCDNKMSGKEQFTYYL